MLDHSFNLNENPLSIIILSNSLFFFFCSILSSSSLYNLHTSFSVFLPFAEKKIGYVTESGLKKIIQSECQFALNAFIASWYLCFLVVRMIFDQDQFSSVGSFWISLKWETFSLTFYSSCSKALNVPWIEKKSIINHLPNFPLKLPEVILCCLTDPVC